MRKDYIDSCVFLGYAINNDQKCKDYIHTIGYMNRNKAIISHFVLSEILYTLIFKINNLINSHNEILVKETAFKLLEEIMNELVKKNSLEVEKLKTKLIDNVLLKELIKTDVQLSEDDTFHIIVAIKTNCDFFVTTDKEITSNKRLREYLSKEHNLKVLEL